MFLGVWTAIFYVFREWLTAIFYMFSDCGFRKSRFEGRAGGMEKVKRPSFNLPERFV